MEDGLQDVHRNDNALLAAMLLVLTLLAAREDDVAGVYSPSFRGSHVAQSAVEPTWRRVYLATNSFLYRKLRAADSRACGT